MPDDSRAETPQTPPMAIRYRPAVPTDTRAMFDVFHDTFAEVDRRLGSPDAVDPTDDAAREAEWLRLPVPLRAPHGHGRSRLGGRR